MNSTSSIVSGLAHLRVSDVGRGEPVVCLHAGVADRRMWAPQQHALQHRYRLIAYDRRGFGETRYEPERFSHVADLMAVLDGLRLDSAVLMGCSMGGGLAIDAALAHPKRVRALVLVASAVSGAPKASDYPPAVQAKLAELEAAEQRGDVAAVNELEAQCWLDGPMQPPGRVGGATRELFLSMNGISLQAAPAGDAIEPPPAFDRLHELTVPTLAIWGPHDFPHVQARMKHVVAQVRGARHRIIEDTAHLPGLERPEEFNPVLVEFLDGLKPSA
ncbi:alpha/beta fold hydrolase [Hyalangium sp.]|uniref:alpha/beta fold hydrolase n=1 Tax=Hyalangium sp. TaxID=2028555 RepID=UPI002D4B61A9|nr:alpha/beta fold hydrolase [Hyalangium sp.]HYI00626.1 alpha/beta fold hydrolase [Hyalangium sp.]